MPTLAFKVPDDWPHLEWLIEAEEKYSMSRSSLLRYMIEYFITDSQGLPPPDFPAAAQSTNGGMSDAIAERLISVLERLDKKLDGPDDLPRRTPPPDNPPPNGNGHYPKAKRPTPRTTIDEPIEIVDTSEDDLDKASNNFLSMFG